MKDILPIVLVAYRDSKLAETRETRPYFEREDDQPVIAFNLNMHDADVDRFVSNRIYFGHLV